MLYVVKKDLEDLNAWYTVSNLEKRTRIVTVFLSSGYINTSGHQDTFPVPRKLIRLKRNTRYSVLLLFEVNELGSA